MLNVLLESKAPHTRRVGGTLASTLVHGTIITAAVLFTVQSPSVPREGPRVEQMGPYIPVEVKPAAPQPERQRTNPDAPTTPSEPTISIPTLDHVATTVTPIGTG